MEIVELEPGDERLARALPVLRELRPHLDPDVEAFDRLYQRCHADGLRLAAVFEGAECRAVAGYRIYSNLVSGKHLYIDDLVTGEQWRSNGHGRALNDYLVRKAHDEGCASIQLDSGVQRADAHRFYFRERYTIHSFHFIRNLEGNLDAS
jgi:GNAT superfamily N-acetyltransferase